jgi:hypothetical protein
MTFMYVFSNGSLKFSIFLIQMQLLYVQYDDIHMCNAMQCDVMLVYARGYGIVNWGWNKYEGLTNDILIKPRRRM